MLDYGAAKSWYVEVFDLRILHESLSAESQVAVLGPVNGDGGRIELLTGPTAPARPVPDLLAPYRGSDGSQFVTMQVADVAATTAELRQRGVGVVVIPFVGASSRPLAILADPWGNWIGLSQ